MYEFCHDYVKPKYRQKAKLYYMVSDDSYKDNAENGEIRFDSSNYELDRPLPKGKSKKVIGLMKDELDGKIMK